VGKRLDRKREFIKALAQFLVGNQAHKSILLQMEKPEAKEWAALRNATPLMGYPTVSEAIETLEEFLL
jgi:hypothetical protein